MQDFTTILIFAGILAGLVNFFVSYINLPFTKPSLLEEDPPKLKDIWWIAIIGYTIIGCAGSFLTPLLNAIIGTGLKGLEWVNETGKPSHPKEPNYYYILFGYGLVFGYSTTRLLVGILDSIIKKISLLEASVKQLRSKEAEDKFVHSVSNNATDIINECESQFEEYKSDCSGFVKSVASAFSITLNGQADNIVDQIRGSDWTHLQSGVQAKEKADNGWFVVAGLKGSDNIPAQNNGHVIIVVSGPVAQGKYPSGYWGKLGGVGEKNKTLNWAWNAASRDNVYYAAKQI
jgi:hypothetical protein